MINYQDPIQGLISYINEIKPFHTKIVEVQMDYVYNEPINVTIKDNIEFHASVAFDRYSPFSSEGWGMLPYGLYDPDEQPVLIRVYVDRLNNQIQVPTDTTKFYEYNNDFQLIDQVSGISSTWTVASATYDPVLNVTNIKVLQPLGTLTADHYNTYIHDKSNWDANDRGFPDITQTLIAATIKDDIQFYLQLNLEDAFSADIDPLPYEVPWGGHVWGWDVNGWNTWHPDGWNPNLQILYKPTDMIPATIGDQTEVTNNEPEVILAATSFTEHLDMQVTIGDLFRLQENVGVGFVENIASAVEYVPGGALIDGFDVPLFDVGTFD